MAIPIHEIEKANERIKRHIHTTPVMTCTSLDNLVGKEVYFKCEHLQKVGAFKIRGALNAVSQLKQTTNVKAIVAHSSGNHAQAVALAGKLQGIETHIVLPKTVPTVKRLAVEGYGAKVYLTEPTFKARQSLSDEIVARTKGVFIHPYDNQDIIIGQGTCGLEFIKQVPDMDAVVVAIGGGGMLTGMGSAIKALNPKCLIIGAEPVMADDAFRSFREGKRVASHSPGKPNTIADGLVGVIADRTFAGISEIADDIIPVTEAQIAYATKLLMERMKQVVEPSGAVPFAALLSPAFPRNESIKKVGVVISGGNIDLSAIPKLMKLAGMGQAARL